VVRDDPFDPERFFLLVDTGALGGGGRVFGPPFHFVPRLRPCLVPAVEARQHLDRTPSKTEVTFAILTGQPSDEIEHIHNRQPQALTAEGARNWINPDLDTAQLHELLAEERHANYDAWPIATRAGSPSNDDAAIMERIETD
jgi:hypothetical protein